MNNDFDELQARYSKPYDMAPIIDTYAKKWADTKRDILSGVNAEAERDTSHQQRHDDTETAIRQLYETMMDHMNEAPSIEIIRDQNGRASAIKKGDRILQIERDASGKARGLK